MIDLIGIADIMNELKISRPTAVKLVKGLYPVATLGGAHGYKRDEVESLVAKKYEAVLTFLDR